MSSVPNTSSSTPAEAIKVKFIKALENYKKNHFEEIKLQALRDLLDIIDFEKVLNSNNINKSLYQQYHGVDGYKDEVLLCSKKGVENVASEAVGYAVDTLLIFAVELDDAELVQDILNFGAKVDICNEITGNTALHHAAEIGNTEIVKLLVAALSRDGFDIDLKGGNYTPLHLAIQEDHFDVIQILLNFGAKVDEQDKYGYTSLHHAAKIGNIQAIKLLLEYKPNLDLKNCDGHTVSELLKRFPELDAQLLNLSAEKIVTDLAETDSTTQFGECSTSVSGQLDEEE